MAIVLGSGISCSSKLIRLVGLTLLICFSRKASSETLIGLNLGLLQDQRSITSRDSVKSNYFDLQLYFQIARKMPLYFGVEYIYMTGTQPNSADTNTATLTSTNPMIGLRYAIGKRQLVSISAMASQFVQATYQVTGSTKDVWNGSAYAGKLSIQPELSESLRVAVALVYFSANYSSKSSTSGSTDVSSFTRGLILPTFGILINF